MTHPEELLAGYVDGALPVKDRAAVETHLAACSRCRGEVSLARNARSALGALPDVPAPKGIAALAIEESRGTAAAAAGGGTPRWYRVAGIAAATAAALVVLTLTLPHIGQRGDAGGATRAAGTGSNVEGPRALSAPDGVEVQRVNYDNDSLSALSSSYARDSAAAGGGAETTSSPASGEFATTQGTPKQTAGALACIQRSAPDATGQLTRLIRARFQGTPAYLALFLDGPGAGQPADTVIVWVFAIDDCRILASSQAKL